MKGISVKVEGNFDPSEKFLNFLKGKGYLNQLDKYGRKGVEALASATPKESGLTAASWVYEIEEAPGMTSITWRNTNTVKGINIAMILQYGHGTGTGGYVQGRDYINPAIQPIFDEILETVRREVITYGWKR